MTSTEKTLRESYRVTNGIFEKMGVTIAADGVTFALTVAEDVPVTLLLYQKGTDKIIREIPFTAGKSMGDVYVVKVTGLQPERYEYNYRIGTEVVSDPYAAVVSGNAVFGEQAKERESRLVRCGFDCTDYDWQEDRPPHISYEEAIIYGLHVRGFTRQSGSKVAHRGTFLGIQEKADYLQELGINVIKLMPAYEFDERKPHQTKGKLSYKANPNQKESRINYWGYDSGCYFAPKASYTAGDDPIREFKDLVRTMHSRGIEVLMEFYFPGEIDPRLVSDCLLHWVKTYHVDGFRLLGSQALCNFIVRDPVLAKTKLLGDYFPVDEIYPKGQKALLRNLGEYNDGFKTAVRKLLKGDENQLEEFVRRLKRNPENCGVINYITCHDGFTLKDLVSYDVKHNEENGEQNQDGTDYNHSWNCGAEGVTRSKKVLELRNRQIKNAFLMLLLSAGTPMILSGDEIGNSQEGNNNPYCLDNEISWVNWKAAKRSAELTEFVKAVITFRKQHKILRMAKELTLMDTLSCGYPDVSYHGKHAWYGGFEHTNRQIGVMYCGKYAGAESFIYVAYNLHWAKQEFALPHLPGKMKWQIAIDTAVGVYQKGEAPELETQNILTVPERTCMVLIGTK